MKYRLLAFGLCLCAIAVSIIAPMLEDSGKSQRYHQHIEAEAKSEKTKGSGFATHLPLVLIDTNDVEIPGKSVPDVEGAYHYTTAADGSEEISASINIIDQEGAYNHPEDKAALSSDIMIKVRGRSSRHFDKSNYSVHLVTEEGLDNPMPVMGMDAHDEWALHGPFLDKTLMRNYMWYNISGEIMGYAPNVRFCEVMLNGEYQGVYVMTETLTAGEDGARLPLTVSADNNTFSGYLLRYNGTTETNKTPLNQFTYYTGQIDAPLEIIYPGKKNQTPEMIKTISQDFSDFEKKLYSYDYDSDKYGYRDLIDEESFIDYFLINEVTCNYDAGRFSTYIGKNISGKFCMYMWDMNSSCDNYQQSASDIRSFGLENRTWFIMMMRDKEFVDHVIERYWKLREHYFDPDYLCKYIDDTEKYLGDAANRNFDTWEASVFNKDKPLLKPQSREIYSHEEALNQMKDFLRMRIAWMDENIESLRQFSAESKVKGFDENAN